MGTGDSALPCITSRSMGQTASGTVANYKQQHQQQMPQIYGAEEDLPCASELAAYLQCLREYRGSLERMLQDCDGRRWNYRRCLHLERPAK